jgi:hypothetical protein
VACGGLTKELRIRPGQYHGFALACHRVARSLSARERGESPRDGDSDMSERFTSMLLAALNDSTEFTDSGWSSIDEALREQIRPTALMPLPSLATENRFAAVVSCGMSKIRSRTEETEKHFSLGSVHRAV